MRINASVTLATILLASLYLAVLLDLSPAQWRGFGEIVAGAFALLFWLSESLSGRFTAPVTAYLRSGGGDPPPPAAVERAFAALSRLPVRSFLAAVGWWIAGGVAVAGGMAWRYASISGFACAALAIAAASCGFATSTFLYAAHKHRFQPLLAELAARLPDPDQRQRLSPRIRLQHKLLVSVTSVTTVTGTFALLLAETGAGPRLFALVFALSAAIAIGVSLTLARDVADATGLLLRAAERVAEGDLRAAPMLHSEDELGDVARSFERTVVALRGAVAGVVGAADGIESVAAEVAPVSRMLADGAAERRRGVVQAEALIGGINRGLEGIADSARSLHELAEESGASIAEMDAAGDQLGTTTRQVSAVVEEVANSIEQVVGSVKRVTASSETLSHAAGETSASMEEMASAMRHVDASAAESAEFSRGAVDISESGREKVRQTIEGMESIRVATEAARDVILGLGSRAQEIGAIVDVIDDVADETNLLALNAAIIAAQAGEHGRAFSVVADEIKAFADRVQLSTREIGELVRGFQAHSTSAADAIEQGVVSVASGVALSVEAGTALEQITRASRNSGERIDSIVRAVREQSKAASQVVALMERVNEGVEAIHAATAEQDRGNEVILRSSLPMRDAVQLLEAIATRQLERGAWMRGRVERVREAVRSIRGALDTQTRGQRELTEFVVRVAEHSASQLESADRMQRATAALIAQSQELRDRVRKFRL